LLNLLNYNTNNVETISISQRNTETIEKTEPGPT